MPRMLRQTLRSPALSWWYLPGGVRVDMWLQVTPEVLYCAKKAGVTHVLKAGGAQAVAAMAWGTESCPKVMSRRL